MKLLLLALGFSVLLLTGCDIFVYDEDEDTAVAVYYSDSGDVGNIDRHLLTGSIEVLDGTTDTFLPGAFVRVEVLGDGRIQDSFVVQTDEQGLIAFEISTGSVVRPYDRLVFEVERGGYSRLRDSIPISAFDFVPDSGGGALFFYQAGAEVYLSRR